MFNLNQLNAIRLRVIRLPIPHSASAQQQSPVFGIAVFVLPISEFWLMTAAWGLLAAGVCDLLARQGSINNIRVEVMADRW